MNEELVFQEEHEFVSKLRELVQGGVKPKDLTLFTPVPVHEVDEILHVRSSDVRFFTLAGGLTGCLTGFAFTIFTVLSWPLITSGKPLISIPPFCVIAFELTILFGALVSFLGFCILGRMPSIMGIIAPQEYGNQYAIVVRRQEAHV